MAQVRGLIVGLGWPLAAILAGFAAGALAAHQLQVRGLWATSLDRVPDLSRLWTFSSGPGLAVRAERAGWSMFKAVVLVVAARLDDPRGLERGLEAGRPRGTGAGSRGRAGRAPAGLGAGRGPSGLWDWSTTGSGTVGSS